MIATVFTQWNGKYISRVDRRFVIEADTMAGVLERAERWILATKGIREVYFQVANDKIYIMSHDCGKDMYTLGYIREEVQI